MPNKPQQPPKELPTKRGSAGPAKTITPSAAAGARSVSSEHLDERQKKIGAKRKASGPPRSESAALSEAANTIPEVPETDCDDPPAE